MPTTSTTPPPDPPPVERAGRPRRRPDRPEPGPAGPREAPLRRPARDRAGGRLPEPRPLALRIDGHLADGRPRAQGRQRLAGTEPGLGQGPLRADPRHPRGDAATPARPAGFGDRGADGPPDPALRPRPVPPVRERPSLHPPDGRRE